jgi:hypothetical protein
MTATNHALTGAVVALVLKNPLLAIPVAFAAHFVMDAIPHFGISEPDVFTRNSSKRFRTILIVDCILAALLLIFVPILLAPQISWWITAFSMVACMSPDLVWGYHFYHETRHKIIKKKRLFSVFHHKIQWSETLNGIYIEAAWFFGMSVLIVAISSS